MQNNSAGPVTDKRRLILDAAQHVFAENGFHTSTMDAVAEAAGVAKGTIYLYFKGKNELLIDLVDDRTGQLTDMILQGIATARDVPGKLLAIIEAHFEFYSIESEFMSLLSGQLGLLSSELEDRVVTGTAALTNMVLGVIEEGMAAGVLSSKVDPTRASYALQGMIHSVAYQWLSSGKGAPASVVSEEVYTLFNSGIACSG